MKRICYTIVAAVAVGVLVYTPLYALRPVIDETTTVQDIKQNTVAQVAAVRDDLKAQVEQKKAEIQQRVEAKKAEHTEKLSDKRLEVCKKHESKINSIISKSNAQSQKHLEVFEKIEDRVKTFYTDKQLQVANYDQLLKAVDDAHTAAAAELAAGQSTQFSCDTTDAVSPGSTIKDVMANKNDALQSYRAALKDLIVAIKGASTSTTDSTPGTEANQ